MNLKDLVTSPYQRYFLLRSEIEKLLTLSVMFSIGLLVVRVIHTRHLTYTFLIWNLFLAFVPYCFSSRLSKNPSLTRKKLLTFFFFLAWLLCVPNSFYVLTDLFHLGESQMDNGVPLWYDLVLIFSFAWNSLIMGILSIRQMEKILLKHVSWKHELYFLYPVMWLNALGIYTGRYLRYNTWDVIADPFQLIRDIGMILIHPFVFHNAWSMIICFSVLMTFIYLSLKRLSASIAITH